MNESDLEKRCLDWFRDNGWAVDHGPDIAPGSASPLRADYRTVVLESVLSAAVARLNPQLPPAVVAEVVAIATKPAGLDPGQNNRAFHKLLLDGVPVRYTRDDKEVHDRAFLVDFERAGNNDFRVVNQFTIQGTKQPRRPDVVCFLNGLPIALVELKNPADEHADIWSAFNQLETYKAQIPDLLVFNEALVISDGLHARVGSLTANQERYPALARSEGRG